MNEIEYNYFVIKIGYFLLLARFAILISFLFKYRWVIKSNTHRYLLFYGVFALSIALIEQAFIYIANNYTDAILPFLNKYEIDDTFFTSPLYFLNEIIFLGIALSNGIGGKLKKYLIQIVFIFSTLEILNTIFYEGYKDSQTLGSFSTSLFLIVLALLYISLVSNKNHKSNSKDSFFIIACAILALNIFSILIFLFTKGLFETNTRLYYQISVFRMAIEIICLLVFAYGGSLVKKTKL